MASSWTQRGTATIESAALAALIAALAIAAVAAIAGGAQVGAGRDLASTLGRKIRCGVQGPGPCWQDSLTVAYGRSVAGAVRALAPPPAAVQGLLPVDFRSCRSAGCAAPGTEAGLTASNRRISAFVAVDEGRASEGAVTIVYWLYRPSLGWERAAVEASAARVAALAGTPLLEASVPRLVPLETLSGRNHYDFVPGEEPPWRWRVDSVYP